MIDGLALSRWTVGVGVGGFGDDDGAVGVGDGDFDDDEDAASGGYIGGGPLGGGGNGIGDDGGTAVGIGVDGDGKTVFWLAFGGLIGLDFGCEMVGGESLTTPICFHCSSGGSLSTRLGKSSSSNRSRFCSRVMASGK